MITRAILLALCGAIILITIVGLWSAAILNSRLSRLEEKRIYEHENESEN